jgi:outer membrane protein OmpA-like peptidoglycan-associated protein
MIYVLTHFGLWFLAALAIGALTGVYTRQAEPRGKISPWLLWALIALGAGLLAAVVGVLQGRAGLWLETGLAVYASFLLGASAGALGRSGHLEEHKDWALGLIPAALIWLGANLFEAPKFEHTLATNVDQAMRAAGEGRPQFAIAGRDVLLDRANAANEALKKPIEQVDGVRQVELVDHVPAMGDGVALESSDKAKSDVEKSVEKQVEAVKAEAHKVAEEVKAEAKKATAGWTEPGKVAEQKAGEAAGAVEKTGAAVKNEAGKAIAAIDSANAKVESGAEFNKTPAPAPVKTQAEKTKAAKEELATLPASGALDVVSCQKGLDATQGLEKIQFRSGSSTITRAAAVVLDRLKPFLARCPETKIEIGGHTDNVGDDGDNQALSQRRADAVLRYLVREGVAPARLSAVGYGAKRPLATNDTEDGRAENRRIEFVVK